MLMAREIDDQLHRAADIGDVFAVAAGGAHVDRTKDSDLWTRGLRIEPVVQVGVEAPGRGRALDSYVVGQTGAIVARSDSVVAVCSR